MTKSEGKLTKQDTKVEYSDLPGFAVTAKGHQFCFLLSGAERIDGLVQLIDGAKTSLNMCFYMFEPDAAGNKVRGVR